MVRSPKRVRLVQLSEGESALVVEVVAERRLKGRLKSMGITRGEKVTVEEVALAGGPVKVRVKGTRYSLRREEADAVVVVRMGGGSC